MVGPFSIIKNTSFESISYQSGKRNYQYLPLQSTLLWPFWFKRQLKNLNDQSLMIEPFPLILNHSFRNWTVLSHPLIDTVVTMSDNGEVHLKDTDFSVSFALIIDNEIMQSNKAEIVHEMFNEEDSSLIMMYKFEQVDVQLELNLMSSANQSHVTLQSYSIQNTTDKPLECSFLYIVLPCHLEGLATIASIEYINQSMLFINNVVSLIFDKSPNNIVCTSFKDSHCNDYYKRVEMILKCVCKEGLASAFVEYKLQLNPSQIETIVCKLPFKNKEKKLFFMKESLKKIQYNIQHYKQFNDRQCKEDQRNQNQNIKNQCSELQFPCKKTTKLYKQNIVHLINFIGSKTIRSGIYQHANESLLNRSFFMKATTLIGYKEHLTHRVLTEKIVRNLINQWKKKQLTVTQLSKWCCHYLDVVFYHVNGTNNNNDLKLLTNIVKKISKKTIKKSSENYLIGLIQARQPMKSENTLYFSDSLWFLVTLTKCKEVYKQLNESFPSELNDRIVILESQIEKAITIISQKQFAKEVVPVTPYIYANLELIDVLEPIMQLPYLRKKLHRHIVRSLKFLIKQCVKKGLLVSMSTLEGISIERNLQFVNICQQYPELKTKSYQVFQKLTQHIRETGAIPDRIHPLYYGGISRESHSLVPTALVIEQLISMCVKSPLDNVIELFSGIPDEWFFENNDPITIKNCPTRFGSLSVSLKHIETRVECDLLHSFSSFPDYLIIYLPSKIVSFTMNNHTLNVTGPYIKVPFKWTKIIFNYEA